MVSYFFRILKKKLAKKIWKKIDWGTPAPPPPDLGLRDKVKTLPSLILLMRAVIIVLDWFLLSVSDLKHFTLGTRNHVVTQSILSDHHEHIESFNEILIVFFNCPQVRDKTQVLHKLKMYGKKDEWFLCCLFSFRSKPRKHILSQSEVSWILSKCFYSIWWK